MQVGVDTGGTFTDVVGDDGRIAKVPSTPEDLAAGVRAGIDGLSRTTAPARPALLAHGTTVATNALLERRGGRVALMTTAGFADVIEIGRQDRPSLYDIWADRPEPLVPRGLRLEVVVPPGAVVGGAVVLLPYPGRPCPPAVPVMRASNAITSSCIGKWAMARRSTKPSAWATGSS